MWTCGPPLNINLILIFKEFINNLLKKKRKGKACTPSKDCGHAVGACVAATTPQTGRDPQVEVGKGTGELLPGRVWVLSPSLPLGTAFLLRPSRLRCLRRLCSPHLCRLSWPACMKPCSDLPLCSSRLRLSSGPSHLNYPLSL